MRKSRLLDAGLVLMALPVALLLVWASRQNALDMIITGVVLTLPIVSLVISARSWSQSAPDQEPY